MLAGRGRTTAAAGRAHFEVSNIAVADSIVAHDRTATATRLRHSSGETAQAHPDDREAHPTIVPRLRAATTGRAAGHLSGKIPTQATGTAAGKCATRIASRKHPHRLPVMRRLRQGV